MCIDYVVLLLLKFGGHIVRRTCADSSFQPVSNPAVECAVIPTLVSVEEHWSSAKNKVEVSTSVIAISLVTSLQ